MRGPSAKVGTRGDDGQGIWYPKKRIFLLNLSRSQEHDGEGKGVWCPK